MNAAVIAALAAALSAAAVPAAAGQLSFDTGPPFRYVADVADDSGTIRYLASPEDIYMVEHGGKVYVIATSAGDNALGVFDITHQGEMDIVWDQLNEDDGTAGKWGLSDPTHIEPFEVAGDDKKYVLVTSPGRVGTSWGATHTTVKEAVPDHAARGAGLQLVDVTDPAEPGFVSFVGQGAAAGGGAKYDYVGGAYSSAVFSSGTRTYSISAGDFGVWLPGGLTVVDITDPASPSLAWQSDSTWPASLEGYRNAVDVVDVGGVPHAVVAVNGMLTNRALDSDHDGNLQIVSLADPSSPSMVYSSNAGALSAISDPDGVVTATVGGVPYAFVAAHAGDKTVVHAVNLGSPSSPSIAATMTDDRGGFRTLDGAAGLHFEVLDGRPYLFVPAWGDNGVQFVDVSDPARPRAVSDTRDEASDSVGNVCSGLAGATGIDVLKTAAGKTYAAIAAQDDDALQMLEFTNTRSLRFLATGVIQDDTLGFSTLETPFFVDDFEIAGRTYLAVTSFGRGGPVVPAQGGVQIIDVTNPHEPVAASSVSSDYSGVKKSLQWLELNCNIHI